MIESRALYTNIHFENLLAYLFIFRNSLIGLAGSYESNFPKILKPY